MLLYNLEKAKLKNTRKPAHLPLEDIKGIYLYIQLAMKKLCSEYHYWSTSSFVENRNLVMSWLTLFNARRSGEAERLQIDWKEDERDGWIDSQRLKTLSESDQIVVKSMKIAYQTGKVSLLILNDTIAAIKTYATSQEYKV